MTNLQTPNFALDPADIPRVEEGPIPLSRTTLQHLVPPISRNPTPAYDSLALHSPPTVLLDFMYGVAAYKRWGSGQAIDEEMQQRFEDKYLSIPIPPVSDPSDSGTDNDNPDKQHKGKRLRSDMSEGMLLAMDNVLLLSMLMKGITPQDMAAKRQKREEEEELRSQEASRTKVEEWMRHSLVPFVN
jgi:hypothetical protein